MAVYFDGSVNNIFTSQRNSPVLLYGVPWSIGIWLRIVTDNTGYQPYFGSRTDAGNSYSAWWFTLRGAGSYGPDVGRWDFSARARSIGNGFGTTFAKYGADATWRLLICAYAGGTTVSIYDALEHGTAQLRQTAGIGDDIIVDDSYNSPVCFGSLYGQQGPVTEMAQAFIVPYGLSAADTTALAGGALISSIATPTNWWKLDDKDDTLDYGTAGNDLIKTGSPTTVAGPSVLQPSAVTINCGFVSLGVVTKHASVATDKAIQAALASLRISTPQASAAIGAKVEAATAALSLQAQGARLVLNVDVPAGTAALSIAAPDGTVTTGQSVKASTAVLTAATQAAQVFADTQIAANLAALTVDERNAVIGIDQTISADTAALLLQTFQTTIDSTQVVRADVANLSLQFLDTAIRIDSGSSLDGTIFIRAALDGSISIQQALDGTVYIES